LVPTESQKVSIEHLHRLRGDLIHLSATAKNVDIREVLMSAKDAIDVIEFLLLEAQLFPINLPELQDRSTALIGEIRGAHERVVATLS
jgi:hypothetical protein